jgi:hypothetical protein
MCMHTDEYIYVQILTVTQVMFESSWLICLSLQTVKYLMGCGEGGW